MALKTKSSRGTICGCPAKGNSYTESLYAAVRRRGIEVEAGIWAGRWLFEHVGPGDTLHLHWPSFLYYHPTSRVRSLISLLRFFAICMLLRLRGVRIVWTAHNLYPHDGAKSEWMHRLARRFLIRVADRIFVHGRTAAAIVRQEFNVSDDVLRIIPHGNWIGQPYPNTTSSDAARRSLGVPGSAYVFLFVGLCKPYKGLEALIDAMAAQGPGAFLLIAGKFPSPEYQEAIVARAEQVGTRLISIQPGYVEDSHMQLFLNAADAVVLPYREILTSGAAVLAMSFGRPVIAPRLGSLVDLVNDSCGILYGPDDTDGLPNAMRAARSTQFSEADILKHISNFTWDDAALPLIEVHCGHGASARAGGATTSITD